jgi:hypothetical protein
MQMMEWNASNKLATMDCFMCCCNCRSSSGTAAAGVHVNASFAHTMRAVRLPAGVEFDDPHCSRLTTIQPAAASTIPCCLRMHLQAPEAAAELLLYLFGGWKPPSEAAGSRSISLLDPDVVASVAAAAGASSSGSLCAFLSRPPNMSSNPMVPKAYTKTFDICLTSTFKQAL